MRHIYVLLTRSGSVVSRAISLTTGDLFTHSSIAYDDSLFTLCSFARRYQRLIIPAGLVNERLESGYYHRHSYIPCALMRLTVPDEVYLSVRNIVGGMLSERKKYRYDTIGLLLCRLGRSYNREKHYFCSRFVGEMLLQSGAIASLPKPAALMRPQDFLLMPELELVYMGSMDGLVKSVRQDSAKPLAV